MAETHELSKRVVCVGFWRQELVDLVEHLETTGYNVEHTAHLKDILNGLVQGNGPKA